MRPHPSAQAELSHSAVPFQTANCFSEGESERRYLTSSHRSHRAARSEGRAARVLDIGCATGALLASLRDEGWDCAGVEVCVPAADYGRERFGLDIRPTVLEKAGFAPGSFDLIHASHLIEHLNEPGAFLACARNLLASGGRILITTPNISGFQARLLGSRWRSAIHDHLFLFSRRSLARLLSESGFRIRSQVTWGGWAAGLKPAFLKPLLDPLARRTGQGDVIAFLCEAEPETAAGASAAHSAVSGKDKAPPR
ncbi:MAG: class I SAM-dependent methyltransferase [Spirochaetota bacterium]